MLNYGNLNDVEFEYLCQDIMQQKLDTELRRFARGKDGGIDLTDDVHSKNIVVQVKHYMTSTVAQLMTSLKGEVDKVAKLSPKEYYICCSKELSPQKVDEIYQMFSPYMSSASNVIALTDIDDFLNDPANIEILKKHYKLWIESTGILQDLNNTNVFIDCETLLADIESEKNLFVKTSAFSSALKCLQDNKTLFITGHPGVGKTVISKMLVLHYAAIRYKVRFSTNVSDLDELKKSLSRNPEIKEIILVDDCFGQAYFNMKESQNAKLLALINYVNSSPNKVLILNSRITILQEAKGRKPELLKCFEGKQCKVYILDMTAIDIVEKAKIFYNHISFNGMGKEYFAEIKKDKRYYNIIRHPNYTPRVIEFICNPNRYKDIPPAKYYEFAMQQLNNPKEIWKDEYERRLEKVDRLLLLTLYSLSDSAVSEETVKNCFECRIASEPDIDTTINQYEASLSRLLEGFVQLISANGIKKLAMVNPSVNDYLDGRLNASALERQQLIDRAYSIQQKKRLLPPNDFDGFVQSALKNHEIESYLFDSEKQKNAFIAFYVCKYKILDTTYTPYIYSHLNAPSHLRIYGNESVFAIRISRAILQEDICAFYGIGDFLTSECDLEQMLNAFVFDEMVDIISLINHFYNGDARKKFVEIASEQLRYAIESLCESLDADEFDPDVDHAIEMSRYFNGEYEDIDTTKAATYIEENIMSDVEDSIDRSISTLPVDIRSYQDYTDRLNFSIYGAEDLVNSHLEYDGDDYKDYLASQGAPENPNTENVVIYARFSSHSQTEQSIEGQLKVCYDYAKANNYTVVGEYIDRAISGTSDNRPEFQRMIADSERHTFEGVLVYQLDRFSRNRYDSAINKAKLKKNDVRVISARENIADDASGILIEGVLESMAEYYSAELAQKIHRGMQLNAKKCLSNGSNPGLGFKVAEDRTFYMDENEAVIVREIFERYAKGETVTEIINDLNTRQIKTSLGREFNKNSLHRMLRNKRYIGTYLYKDEETPGGMPRIIEDELFDRVQAIMDKNKAAPARSRGKEEYVLTTKLFCGYCREMMTGYGGTGKSGKAYHYYACKNAKKHKCQKKVVDKNRIEKLVYDTCIRLLTDENIKRIAEAIETVCKNDQDTFAVKRIRDAIKEADKAIENLWAALEKGEATGMVTERITKRQQEKAALEAQLAVEQRKELLLSADEVKSFLTKLQKGDYRNPVHRRCTISIFIRAIYLYDDRFTIYLNGSNQPIAIEGVFLDEVEDYFDSQFSDKAECSSLVADAPPQKHQSAMVDVFYFMWHCRGKGYFYNKRCYCERI